MNDPRALWPFTWFERCAYLFLLPPIDDAVLLQLLDIHIITVITSYYHDLTVLLERTMGSERTLPWATFESREYVLDRRILDDTSIGLSVVQVHRILLRTQRYLFDKSSILDVEAVYFKDAVSSVLSPSSSTRASSLNCSLP